MKQRASPVTDDLEPLPRQPARRRRPWLAALLSLLPGLGHAYAGYRNRAIALFAIDWVLGQLVADAMVFYPGEGAGIWVPVALYIAWRLWIVVNAWRAARHPRGRWAGLSRGRRTVAVLGFAGVALLVTECTSRNVRESFVETFRIPSVSMEPTILAGDFIIATIHELFPLEHGSLVVYRAVDVDHERQSHVHRLVGLPHDTLAMVNGTLIRNGGRIAEPYALTDTTLPDPAMGEMASPALVTGSPGSPARGGPTHRYWGPLVVPAEHVFVLGDNRDNSRDSRYVGFIPVDHVEKLARRIYWSRDRGTGAVRWERVGRHLK